MTQVDSIAAFMHAWQQGEACCWALQPGNALIFAPLPAPVLTLRILPGSRRDDLVRQVLTWRFQHSDRYEGCYISMDAGGALSLICFPTDDDDPHDLITTLCSLGDLR
ncbi:MULTISPECIES: hypothetical protein [unclassified Erwinia]|uniref:hypothetical protein n=1 Tax=unclassified Erwinia TaxID=2622719 RepID=UPI00082F53E6|nr:hypothetical protein [Erwinia sp. ErVv1]